jgi:N-acylglucosamine 2-epimerase
MIEALREKYRRELFESVIPFWMRHSVDRENGGFWTCLDRRGGVYDPRKYIWLQGRQIWMFSRLYREWERREEWLELARHGMEFLERHGRDEEGRYYFRLEPNGEGSAVQRKPYGAVFAMLGMLEYGRASGEKRYEEEAKRLFWRIREWIARPELLGRPALGGPRMQQLADVMVVAAMALEIAREDGDERYREVLRDCLRRALWHREAGREVLIENVGEGGERFGHLPEGRLLNPGHSVETAWFLWLVMERLGDWRERGTVLDLIEGSLRQGWDKEYGGLYYFVDIEGRPPLQLEANMKLWWPHTEGLYAAILAYARTGEQRWEEWIGRLDEYSFRCFADGEYGEWFGYCDRQGRRTHELKGNHYKGCFHLPRFLLFSLQELEGIR